MEEESKQRSLNMDFSQLHTYTPPQCAPENTGYTYSLSSSYSTAALEFEKEHQIAPVYESPRMSRRSLRLQTSASHYGNENLVDYSQNHHSSSSSSYTSTSTRRETRTLRSRKQQSSSNSLSLSLSQAATPRKTLTFSAGNTPINSSSSLQQSSTASDAAQITAIVEQPHLRQRTVTTTTTTTYVDGHWGQTPSHSLSSVNGDASTSKSHAALSNGYICRDCSVHSQKTDSFVTQSASSLLSSSSSSTFQAAEPSTDALSSTSSPFTSIYSRDRSRRNKTGEKCCT
uniref:Sad1 and UNC84 domain containing 1b n=1 Tax=Neolamprologus brichardi TaxID=32507 RepID=A0A3Q4FZ47_NEOBR